MFGLVWCFNLRTMWGGVQFWVMGCLKPFHSCSMGRKKWRVVWLLHVCCAHANGCCCALCTRIYSEQLTLSPEVSGLLYTCLTLEKQRSAAPVLKKGVAPGKREQRKLRANVLPEMERDERKNSMKCSRCDQVAWYCMCMYIWIIMPYGLCTF